MMQHIARRGLEYGPALIRRAQEHVELQMPVWGTSLLALTFIVCVVGISLVQYTLTDVLPVLAMVETPAAAITVSHHADEPADKSEKEGLLETGPIITLVHQKPITASIRGSIRHLVAEAGRLARWRGFLYQAVYTCTFACVVNTTAFLLPRFVPLRMLIVAATGGAVTANLHAAWTHKVISTPSSVSFWSRVPGRKEWKVLALPAAVAQTMPYLSLYLSKGLVCLFRLDHTADFANYTGAQWTSFILRWVAVVVVSVSSALFLCLPAAVTQVRVEASLLPEDQDSIVPFDRTFGGKVEAKVLGGTGCVGFLDAWRSFTWEARRRLIKLYVKGFMCVAALGFILVHVLLFEAFAIMGPELVRYVAEETREQGMML